jgi:hypothetical protein
VDGLTPTKFGASRLAPYNTALDILTAPVDLKAEWEQAPAILDIGGRSCADYCRRPWRASMNIASRVPYRKGRPLAVPAFAAMAKNPVRLSDARSPQQLKRETTQPFLRGSGPEPDL